MFKLRSSVAVVERAAVTNAYHHFGVTTATTYCALMYINGSSSRERQLTSLPRLRTKHSELSNRNDRSNALCYYKAPSKARKFQVPYKTQVLNGMCVLITVDLDKK